MNSTESGIKRFVEHYGEINHKTMAKFFGYGKRQEAVLKKWIKYVNKVKTK